MVKQRTISMQLIFVNFCYLKFYTYSSIGYDMFFRIIGGGSMLAFVTGRTERDKKDNLPILYFFTNTPHLRTFFHTNFFTYHRRKKCSNFIRFNLYESVIKHNAQLLSFGAQCHMCSGYL